MDHPHHSPLTTHHDDNPTPIRTTPIRIASQKPTSTSTDPITQILQSLSSDPGLLKALSSDPSLLRSLGQAGASGEGFDLDGLDEDGVEGIGGMGDVLDGMMKQLMNREILEEPLEELAQKVSPVP
jgi:hypothetical protein